MKRINSFKKVRLILSAGVALIGIGSLSSFRDAQIPTYYLTNTYHELPGGAAGEGIEWICVNGVEFCTYDQNKQPIGLPNRQYITIDP